MTDYQSTQDLKALYQALKKNHLAIKKTSADERIKKLQSIKKWILDNRPAIRSAMAQDFSKPEAEVDTTEVFTVLSEIGHAISHLHDWILPVEAQNNIVMLGQRGEMIYEPKGVCLIIAPWNYPFSLAINPLVAAIAAGNCAVVKPSELTSRTAALLHEMISKLFKKDEVVVVQGDASVSQALLTLPWDHIFFTGSTRVGKIVMRAASEHLSSVTLELGGKSPAIVHSSADLKKTAERLIWGKGINSGQTCIAPDYVLVPEALKESLVKELQSAYKKLYVRGVEDQAKIINENHFQRLKGLVDQSVAQGAQVVMGGSFNLTERRADLTVLTQVKPEHPVMADEIFGPVLPVLTYTSDVQIIELIERLGKPLALYLFAKNKKWIRSMIEQTSAGGTCVNNCLVHITHPELAFGGVGPSGLGNYHGFYGFRAFSHERAVFYQSRLDLFRFFFPPYVPRVRKMIDLMIRFFT